MSMSALRRGVTPRRLTREDRLADPSEVRSVDFRRWLQLALGAIWLLDGLLQLQSFMFTRSFGTQMLAGVAQGNPGWTARSITWAAGIVAHHPQGTDALFAVIQVLLGLAIAWRPTVKPGLAASVAWALVVWWFGEGLGGVLAGTANPLSGAPGAVIIYALIAVLVWPTERTGAFVAARAVGSKVARGLWVVLWGSLAYFSLLPANTAPQAMHDMIAGMAQGVPGWLSWIENHSASLVAGRGMAASIVLAVVMGVIALGVLLPARLRRPALVLAVVAAVVIWVVGETFGGLYGGQGTDPNSGPLLALLALAYWPLTAGATSRPATTDPAAASGRRPQRTTT